MAYITQSVLKQISNSVTFENKETKSVDTLFEEYVTKKVVNFLNKKEKEKLAVYAVLLALLENKKSIEKIVFKPIYINVGANYRYINGWNYQRCYHKNNECSMLKKDFDALNVPSEFYEFEEDIRKERIEELNQWAVDNNFTAEEFTKGKFKLETFVYRYNMIFPKKYPEILKPLNEHYKLLEHRDNSGEFSLNASQELKNVDTLLQEIETCKKHYYQLGVNTNFFILHSYLYNKEDTKIEKFTKDNTTADIKILRDFLKQAHILKQDFTKAIQNELYQQCQDVINNFDSYLLQSLNLKPCSYCCQEYS